MQIITRTLLDNASETGNAEPWNGWRGTFIVEGTLNGATVSLQYKSPEDTWIDVDPVNLAFTDAGMAGFECPPGDIRAEVSGGTPSALYAWVKTNDDV